MIEEMAKEILKKVKQCDCILCQDCEYHKKVKFGKTSCQTILIAEDLIKKGYRKIPEDSVVLSREEYEDLQVGKDFDYGYHEGYKNTEAYYENFKLPEIRKETAEKILQMLIPPCEVCDENLHKGCLCLRTKIAEKIAKQFGVEII